MNIGVGGEVRRRTPGLPPVELELDFWEGSSKSPRSCLYIDLLCRDVLLVPLLFLKPCNPERRTV